MRTKLMVGLAALSVTSLWLARPQLNAAPEKDVTLLGTLAEWKYPDSEFHGASGSDGGNRLIQSVKFESVMTTADSVDKVTKYYADKFQSGPADREKAPAGAIGQSVSVQDDSKDRPLQLQIIVINRTETSTTLVISRAKDEQKTHIAWSHYLRFGDKQ
jgi:hypothetical protein